MSEEVTFDKIKHNALRWFEENKKNLKLTGKPLQDAYTLMVERLRILDDAEIYMEGDKSLTFRTVKPCPVHEACKILGIDSKRICKAVCENSASEFLKHVDPRLNFTIQHKKDGPEEYAIETIELKEE